MSTVPAAYLKLWHAFKERNPKSEMKRADHVSKMREQRKVYLNRTRVRGGTMSLVDWADKRAKTVKVCKYAKAKDGSRVQKSCRRVLRCAPDAKRNSRTSRCNKCAGKACKKNAACRRRCGL